MRTILCILAVLLTSTWTDAAIHISPQGDDANPGTAEKPLATIAQAVKQNAQEIILHEGVYHQHVVLAEHKDAPPLLITAAKRANGEYERVVFDQGHQVDGAEAVQGMPGVYRVPTPKTFSSYQSRRSMWESDTRIRYRDVADVRAVAAFTATYRFESDGFLYFHTSDNQPPGTHDIGFDISDGRFTISRDNTTVRGIEFHGGGVRIIGANIVIEDCHAWNTERMAFYVSASCPKAAIRNCTGSDLGSGIYSEGGHTTVEGCRFSRAWDAFESHAVSQDSSAGIQLYRPAKLGVIRNNLTVGFRTGIFCKGTTDVITVEGNTCYGGGGGESTGITLYTHWLAGCVIRNNIVSDHHQAYYVGGSEYARHCVFRDNLLWNVTRTENIAECFAFPQALGSVQGVIMADPRFAAPVLDDFRLLPDSPALRADGSHLGKFGGVNKTFRDTQAPTLALTLDRPATILGRTVEHYWERDHWQPGGGERERRETTFEVEDGNQWLAPDSKVRVLIAASDNATSPSQMKLRIGNGDWSQPKPLQPKIDIELPSDSVDTTIVVMISDEAGNWSKPATLRAFKVTEAPKLVGRPTVYVTKYGFIMAFRTNIPCTATLEWGYSTDYGQTATRPADTFQRWRANDGGEWTQKRTGPRQNHHLVVKAPDVEPGKTYHFRIALDNGVGHVGYTKNATVTLNGEPRTIVLSPDGNDVEGTAGPWKTLQFAVDRALPGDRIVLRDGLYTEPTVITHGGAKGAPIVIEAEHVGKATLDVGKRHPRAIQMYKTPWITLRGLEIRWFDGTGVQVTHSEHVTMENLRIWNQHLVKGRRTGFGFYARRSPNLTVRGCLFFYLNGGLVILDSPRFHIENNTASSMLHRGCRIIFSSRDSTFVNNCFTFTGNDHLQIYETRSDWETFDCDYNNFAAVVRDTAPRRPAAEHDIKRWSGGHWAKISKGVNYLAFRKADGWEVVHGFSLKEWQDRTGKDAHSIYKRPLYVDPTRNDWRLQPSSPNIGAGREGVTIGATGIAE